MLLSNSNRQHSNVLSQGNGMIRLEFLASPLSHIYPKLELGVFPNTGGRTLFSPLSSFHIPGHGLD